MAPTAPILTYSLYVDDLILFGHMNREKVRELKLILNEFDAVSGIKINSAKSRMWFSKYA